MSFCCHQFPSMDLNTFSITSDPEVKPLQLRYRNLSLRNLQSLSETKNTFHETVWAPNKYLMHIITVNLETISTFWIFLLSAYHTKISMLKKCSFNLMFYFQFCIFFTNYQAWLSHIHMRFHFCLGKKKEEKKLVRAYLYKLWWTYMGKKSRNFIKVYEILGY